MNYWRFCKHVSYLIKWLPRPIYRLLWRFLDIFDGKVGAVARYVLVASRLSKCGYNVYIGPFVVIDSPSKVTIGSNVSIHQFVTLLSGGGIIIGDNVSIAHGSSIVSGEHSWALAHLPIKYNPVLLNVVVINDDVWIGCGARILSGVSIGSRTVIAAGAVVTSNCAEHSIYGGVPAKRIKQIQ